LQRSNLRHRPIGIGVQGLADAFILMRYPYERYVPSTLEGPEPVLRRLNLKPQRQRYYGQEPFSKLFFKTH
jgi:hypothetical protein